MISWSSSAHSRCSLHFSSSTFANWVCDHDIRQFVSTLSCSVGGSFWQRVGHGPKWMYGLLLCGWHDACIFTLCAKLSGAGYCYRSCLWRVGGRRVFVCLSVTTITRNFVHRSSPNWVCRWSWLNFVRHASPGRGSAAGRKFLAPPSYSQRAMFASLWALFSSLMNKPERWLEYAVYMCMIYNCVGAASPCYCFVSVTRPTRPTQPFIPPVPVPEYQL